MILNTSAHNLLVKPSHIIPLKYKMTRKSIPPMYPEDEKLNVFHEQHKLLLHEPCATIRNQINRIYKFIGVIE